MNPRRHGGPSPPVDQNAPYRNPKPPVESPILTNTPSTPSQATAVWRAIYTPFGDAFVDEDPDGDTSLVAFSLRLPGQIQDAESGMHYNYFRTYDPTTGRYVSADPIGQSGGVNLYGYVRNNPLRYADPFGLSELEFDRGSGTLTVYPGDGQGGRAQGPPQQFDASNNARSGVDPNLPGGNGPAPDGTFDTGPIIPTPGPAGSALGDKGFVPIDLRPIDPNGNKMIGPVRGGVGIHAGRVGRCDRAGRCGPRHAPDGCIRTTPEAMDALGADPPTQITIK